MALGILVALQRRSERFRRRADEYASAIHTVYFADVNGQDGMVLTASRSRLSRRPLFRNTRPLPTDPGFHSNPTNRRRPITSRPSGSHMQAVKKAYPGLALGDYNVMVTVDDSDDQAVWAVRYRRRDNRSGLTVFLRDPIAIEVHSEGPSTGPSNPGISGRGERRKIFILMRRPWSNSGLQVAASHTFSVSPVPTVAKRVPSGLNARPMTS